MSPCFRVLQVLRGGLEPILLAQVLHVASAKKEYAISVLFFWDPMLPKIE